jgi:hypothetical protein
LTARETENYKDEQVVGARCGGRFVSDPKEILERRLDRAIEEQETKGLHLFCQIGGRYLEDGMTTLQVNGTGWTLLGWRADEDRSMHSVELTWPDQKRLYEIMREYPFWDASPARRDRDEDETNIHLRFSDRDAGTYSGVHFWDTEMETFPVLWNLMNRVTELIQNISNGEIPFILGESLERTEPKKARGLR